MVQNNDRRAGEIDATSGALNPGIESNVAARDDASIPIGPSQGETVLAWSQRHSTSTEIVPTLRSLAAALHDSVHAYEHAARDGEEMFRKIYLGRAKERKEMANELNARILSHGAVLEGEADHTPGFSSSVDRVVKDNGHLLSVVEEHEATLRSLFQAAIDDQSGDTKALLQAHYALLEKSDDEFRHLRAELGNMPD